MKKRKILALVLAFAMIACALPTIGLAASVTDENGTVYDTIGDNMFPNGGFENGKVNFGIGTGDVHCDIADEPASTPRFSIVNSPVHSGNNALTASRTLTFDSTYATVIADHFAATAGKSYYFSFWFCNSDAEEKKPTVTFNVTNGASEWPNPSFIANWTTAQSSIGWIDYGAATTDLAPTSKDGEWVQYSKILTVPTGYDHLYIVVCANAGTIRDCFFDDFELYEVEVNENSATFTAIRQNWEALAIPSDVDLTESIDLSQYVPTNGAQVTWTSSQPTILSDAGVLNAPEVDTQVSLTATLEYAGLEAVYTYNYVAKSVFTKYLAALDTQMAAIGTAISESITLPTTTTEGGTISWASSKPEVITTSGAFTAPQYSTSVVLTATLSVSGKSTQKQYRVVALAPDVIDSDSLVVRYDFSTSIEDGVVTDVSGNGNDGTALNVTAAGGVARFPGNNAITLADNTNTSLTGDYTISMWVNMDSSLDGATVNGLRFFDFGSRASASTTNSIFLKYQSGTTYTFSLFDRQLMGSNTAYGTYNAPTNPVTGKWALLTWVATPQTGGTTKLYLDGTLVTTVTGMTRTLADMGDTSGTNNGLFVGRTQWYSSGEAANNPDYIGYMDDIRVYGRALNDTEIATLYAQTNPKDVVEEAEVTVKFQDKDGGELKSDEVFSLLVGDTYTATAAQMASITVEDSTSYKIYDFDATGETAVEVTSDSTANVLILKFDLATTFEKPVVGGNLVMNGDFELSYGEGDARIPFWTVGNGAAGMTTSQMTTANFTLEESEGNHYIRAIDDTGANGSYSIKRFVELKPNTTYDVSFKISLTGDPASAWIGCSVTGADGIERNRDAVGDTLVNEMRTNTGSIIPDADHLTALTGGGVWDTITTTITTTEEYYNLLFCFRWLGTAFAFDDFEVYETGALEDTTVTINYLDESNRQIKTSRTVETQTGRTVVAEDSDLEVIEYNGSYYFFVGDDDSKQAVAVSGGTAEINLVFKAKTVMSATPVSLKAAIGSTPEFPATVDVTYDDGSTATLDVTWGEYNSAGVEAGDTVNVAGTIPNSSYEVQASVLIYPAMDYSLLYPSGEYEANTTVGNKYKAVDGSNLITNGTFENGDMTGWTTATGVDLSDSSANWSAVAGMGYNNSYGIANGTSGGGAAATTLRTFFPVEGGKSYYLSFYANNTGEANSTQSWMSAAVLTSGGTFGTFADSGIVFKSLSYGGFNSWSNEAQAEVQSPRVDMVFNSGMNHVECVFNVPETGAENLMLSFGAWTAVNQLYLSNFELYEIVPGVEFDTTLPAAKVVIIDGASSETYFYNANEAFVLPESYDERYVDYSQFTEGAIDSGTITVLHPEITLTADSVTVTGVDSFEAWLVVATYEGDILSAVTTQLLTFTAGDTTFATGAATGDKVMLFDKASLKPLAASVVK
ncbi:MAG: LamG-like jellyroll fold domain-containing protein [Clostridia bacterium]|nr:LamG-like jellyroll fold domain-containing protein [Clostridia bacterium]